ncbi:hypothetical protein CBR_g4674 [Chara braunii]|uniref:Uncharacterized protein n=1 Tax=Chara braunii TaxID=69332 RepID=A0A388KIG5_CHABU|nr:hypothetical protein CBR_g4674 [Chara braunii]|eukprot:GBG69844.1 hypothetical protein CBR_g4674 [Chara braunii]
MFFKNIHKPFSYHRSFKEQGQLELIRPCDTRFQSAYQMVERLIDQERILRMVVGSVRWRSTLWRGKAGQDERHVRQLVLSASFWDSAHRVQDVMRPAYSLLRSMDTDGSSSTTLWVFVESIETSVHDIGLPEANETEIMERVDYRCGMMRQPAYALAYLVDPRRRDPPEPAVGDPLEEVYAEGMSIPEEVEADMRTWHKEGVDRASARLLQAQDDYDVEDEDVIYDADDVWAWKDMIEEIAAVGKGKEKVHDEPLVSRVWDRLQCHSHGRRVDTHASYVSTAPPSTPLFGMPLDDGAARRPSEGPILQTVAEEPCPDVGEHEASHDREEVCPGVDEQEAAPDMEEKDEVAMTHEQPCLISEDMGTGQTEHASPAPTISEMTPVIGEGVRGREPDQPCDMETGTDATAAHPRRLSSSSSSVIVRSHDGSGGSSMPPRARGHSQPVRRGSVNSSTIPPLPARVSSVIVDNTATRGKKRKTDDTCAIEHSRAQRPPRRGRPHGCPPGGRSGKGRGRQGVVGTTERLLGSLGAIGVGSPSPISVDDVRTRSHDVVGKRTHADVEDDDGTDEQANSDGSESEYEATPQASCDDGDDEDDDDGGHDDDDAMAEDDTLVDGC